MLYIIAKAVCNIYIMEPDPFLEYCVSEDIELRNQDGIDTVLINDLIRESKITEYFTQLK